MATLSKLVTILLLSGLVLFVTAGVLYVTRRMLERRAREDIRINDASLVGRRAIAVCDLHPNSEGRIRPLGTAAEEETLALSGGNTRPEPNTYPAVSQQFVSKGRVVRVTGGDNRMGYRVRPIRQ